MGKFVHSYGLYYALYYHEGNVQLFFHHLNSELCKAGVVTSWFVNSEDAPSGVSAWK